MGRSKEPESPASDPVEAKKHRDEAAGHHKSGYYDRARTSLNKVGKSYNQQIYYSLKKILLLPTFILTNAEVECL